MTTNSHPVWRVSPTTHGWRWELVDGNEYVIAVSPEDFPTQHEAIYATSYVSGTVVTMHKEANP